MYVFRLYSLALLVLSLTSCTTQSCLVKTLDVTAPDPDRIRFQGKGAGAGMMLMSSMGPMGIAIGVAIDEGIANEIDVAARESGFDINDVLRRAFHKNSRIVGVNALTIERYGFITRPGDDDPVAAQLHVYIVRDDGSQLLVKYPEDFDDAVIKLTQLELIKTDGDEVILSFDAAAVVVFNRIEGLL